MNKKLFVSFLLLLLCACSQSNKNKECLSNQYVDILKSGNYYMSYMDSSIAYDHTPVFMERAQKGTLSAVRYEMQGDVLSSIADNKIITIICNGEVLAELPMQEYTDKTGLKSCALDFSDLTFSGVFGEKTIDGVEYYFETFEYRVKDKTATIDFMYSNDHLQGIVLYESGGLFKDPTISNTYPEDLFVIPEAHANYQDSSSAPAQ
ncbi:hypothetical protein ACS3UN_07345 [Oscillospiraceae bacterium LTW-04]|nr:hypothetical protein RBH76_03000 [Oscillospiraceae bacterium MB24-C1]